ncbi:MAG: cell division protein FtsQ/DivIB [Acidimicrobiales bacterium]
MTSPSVPDVGRVVVDPRFRARRIAVRKQAGRRRLRRLVLLTALAAVALAVVVVFESPVLDVDEIAVLGTQSLDPATIAEAASIDHGAPMFLTDLDEAARSVEALPWIEEASVSRQLPGRVVVDVVERTPSALVTAGGSSALVDRSGRVLEAGDPTGFPAHVPTDPPFVDVVVPDGVASDVPRAGGVVPAELLAAISVAERLRENPSGAVVAVRLEPALSFDLAGGGTVDLGDADDLDVKIEAFRTVHARVDLTCVATVDLRVPTHPILTRNPSC